MKKTSLTFILLILSINLFGCNSIAPAQSTFKENFSLNTIVEANKEYLLDDSRITSGAETGLREPFIQRHEEMIVQIDPSNASTFMEAIRLDVGQFLADNDAHILGGEINRNKDVIFFSNSYSEDDLYGTVTLWGVQGEGTNFFLIVMITES